VFETFYKFVYDWILDDQKTRMDEAGEAVNLSAMAQQAFWGNLCQLSCQKGNSDHG
jgi:hypothetical protein